MNQQRSKQLIVIVVLSIGTELFLLPALVESRTILVLLVPKTRRPSPDEEGISLSKPYDPTNDRGSSLRMRRFGLVPYGDMKKIYSSVLQQRGARSHQRENMMEVLANSARRFTVKRNSLSMLRGLNRNGQKYVNFRNYPTIANFEG